MRGGFVLLAVFLVLAILLLVAATYAAASSFTSFDVPRIFSQIKKP